jgi:large-conductance mechanosensitive channel
VAARSASVRSPVSPVGSSDEAHYGGNFVTALVWFVIIAVIVWLLIAAIKPEWAVKKDNNGDPTDEVNHGRAMFAALLVALVVVVVVWAFRMNSSY